MKIDYTGYARGEVRVSSDDGRLLATVEDIRSEEGYISTVRALKAACLQGQIEGMDRQARDLREIENGLRVLPELDRRAESRV